MEGECGSPESNSANRPLGSDHLHLSNDSFTSNEHVEHPANMATNDISAEECDKFRADLETRCSGVDTDSPQHHQHSNGNNNGNGPISRKDSQSSIEREIIQLNKEMEMIQMECQEIVEAHSHRQSKDIKVQPSIVSHLAETGGRHEPFRSPRMVPRMGTRLDYMKQMLAAQEAAQGQQMYAQQALGMMGGDMQPLWMRHTDQHLNTNQIAKDLSLKPKEVQQLVSSASHSATGSGEDKDKDTSNTSAYNTGDSCRSTPLTLELSSTPAINGHKGSLLSLSVNQQAPIKPSYSDSEKMTQTGATDGNHSHFLAQSQTCKQVRDWSSDGCENKKLRQYLPQHKAQSHHPGNLSKSVSNGSFSENKTSQTPNGDLSQTENADSLQELYAQYADVMYTNRANLEHTIMVQQKLFQQQLMQRSAHARLQDNQEGATGLSQNSLPSTSGLPQSPSTSSHMEWVVKRRADGSRYITRRPIRNKILKERAKKIQEERCGMTTDDDAVSEMKVGRYWTKDERKKHLEKVREHKKRKQEMLKSRMETVKENEEEKKKEPNIVELSHRKMMKHKSKRVFDDFTTVQEMMAHGSREPANQKGYNPLLSVTTV